MNNEKETFISILIQIVIAIFAIILIIQLILKLTGHSPTENQIIYGVITIVVSYIIGGSYKLIYKLGRIDQHLINLDKNVSETNQKLEKIDKRFEGIEERLLHIERKLS